MNFLMGGICVTTNIRLDFGVDPDHDTGTGAFYRNLYRCGI